MADNSQASVDPTNDPGTTHEEIVLHWLRRGVLALESIAETNKIESNERIAQQKQVIEMMKAASGGIVTAAPNLPMRTPRRGTHG